MTQRPHTDQLSRREREIMNVIYRLGRATAAEVQGELGEPPSYSAVRALLRILEAKGHLHHEQDGPRYVYLPTVPIEAARSNALDQLVETFFGGSVEGAVAALLDEHSTRLTDTEIERLQAQIERARREGR